MNFIYLTKILCAIFSVCIIKRHLHCTECKLLFFQIAIAQGIDKISIPKHCLHVKCPAPPTVCPNGGVPIKLRNQCCSVCITEPISCTRLMCATAPQQCPENRPMVKVQGECCAECTDKDCRKVLCMPPTKFCEDGEVPRPRGACCATCKLNCSGIYCLPCQFGEIAVRTPNSCCPNCHSIF